jgi:hypothetical protein
MKEGMALLVFLIALATLFVGVVLMRTVWRMLGWMWG